MGEGYRAPRLVRWGEALVATSASIVGDVRLAPEVSVWYGCVLRGDDARIVIGRRTNLQDGSLYHPEIDEPLEIGEEVTIGHGAIVHARRIGDRVLLGMGAVILAHSEVGEESIIAAGALVPEGRIIPPRSVVIGVPGKVVREVTIEEARAAPGRAARYLEKAHGHL